MNDHSWISATLMGITAIIAAVSGVVLMYKNYNQRKIAEAKEQSVGASALEVVRADIKRNSEQLEMLGKKNNEQNDYMAKQLEELRKDVRDNSTEYLRTLRDFASKFGK